MSADTVDACPECDTTAGIYSRAGATTFGCRECGAAFAEPATRAPKGTTNTQSGVARLLADVDPDEVGR